LLNSYGQIMGRARSWRSAMYVVGPLVGGAVATWLSLRGVFLAESGLLLSMVIIAMLLLARQPSPKPKRIPLLALPSLLWNPAVLALLAILLLDFLNFQVIIFIFPLYASASSLPTYLIGALITAQALAYALVQKPVGKLGDRGVSVPALGICAVIGGPLIFALSLSRSPAVLTVLMLLIGLASAPVFLLVTLLVSKAAGEQTGIAMGMINFIVYLAVGLAPLLTSLLASISLRDGFLVPVGSSALALVLVIIALRAKGTMSEEAAEPAAPDRGLVS
jgi:MFS family permease